MKKLSVIFFLGFLLGCAYPQPTRQEQSNANYGILPADYQDQIIKYFEQKYFDRNLFDPLSTIYNLCGEPHKGYAWEKKDRFVFGWIVCGTVSAKKRTGGYTGQELFMAVFKDGKLFQMNEGSLASDHCYDYLNHCSQMIKRTP